MHKKTHDRPSEKPVQTQQEDRFFARLLSKETSVANSSFRVYYGGSSGAVPFRWEVQPGTPKHPFSDSSLPPLTPPPSYYLSSSSRYNSNSSNKAYSKSNLLKTIFQKISPTKTRDSFPSTFSSFSTSSSSSLSSWSSSRSLSGSSPKSATLDLKHAKRRRFSSSNFAYFLDQEEDEPQKTSASLPTSPNSCFSVPYKASNAFRGCNGKMAKAKNAFLSILGHGSAIAAPAF